MVETSTRANLPSETAQMKQAQTKLMTILESSRLMSSNKNLYEHVISVVDFLVRNYPKDAIEKFEEVSYLIKHGDKQKLETFL